MTLVTKPFIAKAVGINSVTVTKLFAPACVGQQRGGDGVKGNLYDVDLLVTIINERTGHIITANDLAAGLLSRKQAAELLRKLGKDHSLASWDYWARHGMGPRVLRLSHSTVRYTKADVVEWARRKSRVIADPVTDHVPAAISAQPDGANVGVSIPLGNEGGALEKSPPESVQ